MKSLNIVRHKASMSIFKRFQIFQNVLSNPSTIKFDINIKKIYINYSYVWKLRNNFPSSKWIRGKNQNGK